ncbi:MAG: ABC transporter permease subunit [Actinobacteria bacterium]|nr:ABC transporter permease subunit [Actinomycetota bacterium]
MPRIGSVGLRIGQTYLTTSLELLATTAFIAVVSSAISLILGYPVGNFLATLGAKSRGFLGALLVLPFLLPPFLIGITLLPLRGDDLDSNLGILLIICAHVVMNVGFVARIVASSQLPLEQLEAARLDGASNFLVRLRVSLPQQRAALAAAGLLIALYSATSYGLVISLGQGVVATLETEIAISSLRDLDLSRSFVLALLQTLLTLTLFVFAQRAGAKPTPVFGEVPSSLPSRLGAVLALLFVLAIGLIIWNIAGRALSLNGGLFENLASLGTKGAREILNLTVLEAGANSLRNMVVASLIVLPLAWIAAGRPRSSLLYVLPIGISPVVLGLGFLILSGYLPRYLSGWWLVPLVQSIFLFPLAYQIIRPARLGMSREILEMDGATKLRVFGSIEGPILARPLAAAAAFVSLASLGEFGAASFLATGSGATLPLVIFRLASRPGEENLGMAMTAAMLFVLLALVVVLLISRESQTPDRER